MSGPPAQDVTAVLSALSEGDARAADRLIPLVYDELRALAQSHMSGRGDQTLQATAVVHEAYLRLVDQTRARYKDRNHFFAVAATMIRRIMVDHARSRAAAKRGGDWSRITLDSSLGWTGGHELDLVALDDALKTLANLSERQARVVELRFFGGMSIEQAAETLSVSTTTIENDWTVARAWLRRQLSPAS
jgi:RNA polymerase sigma-70 factor, ECF subfamily